MLKIKWRKQKQRERAQAQHWGAPWTILQIKFQGPEMYEKKRLGYKHKWSLVLKSLKHLLSLQISFSS
jgi:hypothetical protein